MVPGRLLSASGDAGGAGEYLRLAFTQAPDVLARSVPKLASTALASSVAASSAQARPMPPRSARRSA